LEARGFAGGGGGGGGGEGLGARGVGGEGRRKEAEEATGLKSLGVGEEAVGIERNCIRMVVSDFRMAREDDATCACVLLLGQGGWRIRRSGEISLVGREISDLVLMFGTSPH